MAAVTARARRLLRLRASERPERDAFIFLADGEDEGARLTWAELDGRAKDGSPQSELHDVS